MVDFSDYKNLSKFEKTFLNEFLNDIEKRENSSWAKSWNFSNYQNAFSGHEYSGLNQIMLDIISKGRNLNDTRFATFNQARENDYHVEKGSKGIQLQFFSFINKRTRKPWNETEFREQAKSMTQDEIAEELKNKVPVAKSFHVFPAQNLISNKNNLSLSENVPLEIPTKKMNTNELIDSFENNLIKNMEVGFVERQSEGAYYTPAQDQVTMPLKEQFNSYEERTAVLLHELGHATGHEKRLNRDLTGTFGSSEYSKEEMKVEMNSVFMTNVLGLDISEEQKENHLLYMDGWGKTIKDDPKEFINALKDSLKIKDYMIEKGKFNELFLEKDQSLEHSINEDELDNFLKAYDDFTAYEYEQENDLDEMKKDILENENYQMPIAYTEEQDDLGIIEFDRQSTYDLENKETINTLTAYFTSGSATITTKEELTISDMTEIIENNDFNHFVSSDNFGLTSEDFANAIKLTAYTNDDKYLHELVEEVSKIRNVDIEYDKEEITLDKNYLLSELDDETISLFEIEGVTISNDFIHDFEYKSLVNHQLKHFQEVKEQNFPPFEKVVYKSDIENDDKVKTYSNYKDLWEEEFRNSFTNELNNFPIEDLSRNEFLAETNPNLIERLGKNYDEIENKVKSVNRVMETKINHSNKDLDNDGIVDWLDYDDNRSNVQTVDDVNKLGSGTNKNQEIENEKLDKVKNRQRSR